MGGEKFKKIKYFLDNRLHNGAFGLVKILVLITVLSVVIITIFVHYVLHYDLCKAVFTTLPTLINSWLPEYDKDIDKQQILSLIIFTFIALIGVFFTSTFLGLITNSIEQWIMKIKDNSTEVYEKDHIIILGFDINTYALLDEIIKGNENKKVCIVIASDKCCDDMRNLISSNVKITRNVRVVFRTIDITNVEDLQKLSIDKAKKVIINLTTNFLTVQILLSLDNLYKHSNITNTKTYALIYRDKHGFISSIKNESFYVFELNKIITKLIAKSSNGQGIANVYSDIFTFDGFELYTEKANDFIGRKYIDVINEVNNAVPIGLISNNKSIINPDTDTVVNKEDKIIMFESNQNAYKILKENINFKDSKKININKDEKMKNCSVIGKNETMDLLKNEFDKRFVKCEYFNDRDEVYKSDDIVSQIASKSDSIVILNNHEVEDKDKQKENAYNMFLMKKFENYRDDNNLKYFITLEMSENANKWHTENEAGVDFIIASDLHSKFLAQLAEKSELIDVFRELLSAEGCEINEINISRIDVSKKCTIQELRNDLYNVGYILIGFYDMNSKKIMYKVDLTERIDVNDFSSLIVISKKFD